jgi:chromosome partitioning protein
MSLQAATRTRPVRVIVVGNEKGGSGKSTVAMHVAVALLKSNRSVASIDLDTRQKSLTNYVENRREWAKRRGRDLETPEHLCIDQMISFRAGQDEAEVATALIEAINALADNHEFIVIDTAGHDSQLMRLVHSMADTLITPLNDSFVDFDVLGSVDPETFGVVGTSHYAETVTEANQKRLQCGQAPTDWIVLRNRLSMLTTRNKRMVGEGLQELSRRLNFRFVEGLAERMIFREFFPRGLTALDDLDEGTLGTRPTMSHVTARQEVENLLGAMGLADLTVPDQIASPDRDAA